MTFSDIIGLHHHIGSFSSWCYLEHLVPNPLGRLPSAILCEHHVQKPPAELPQKHQWTRFRVPVATFEKVEQHTHTPTPVGLWNHPNNPNVIQRKWFIIRPAKIEEITLINFYPIFYLKWPRKTCPKPFQIEDIRRSFSGTVPVRSGLANPINFPYSKPDKLSVRQTRQTFRTEKSSRNNHF